MKSRCSEAALFVKKVLTKGGSKWFKVCLKATAVQDMDIGRSDESLEKGLFVHNYTHYLDSKRRLTVPAVWRELVGVPRRLFVLQGVNDQCLCVYPARELIRRMDRLRNLSIADDQGRQFARTLASRAELVPWDSQGRIRIKDDLLEYAGLSNEVVMAGTFDGFELWSPEKWKEKTGPIDPAKMAEAARYVGF